jgi:ribosome maturation factor RimP
MIDKDKLTLKLEEVLRGTDIFPVDMKVDRNNRILIYVDRMEGISIDDCVKVSRALEARLDRDTEDFSLEVSSPGLDAPFKVYEQYAKSKGKLVLVQCRDGRQFRGVLSMVSEKGIRIDIPAGKKGEDPRLEELAFEDIASTRIHIDF